MKNKNYFELDEIRDELIKKKEFKSFIESYKFKTVLINPNTQKVWNGKILKGKKFNDLDPMSMDRIMQIVKMIKGKSGKILDLGFGYGYFEQKIKEKKNRFILYGIDISRFAVNEARKKYGCNFFTGNISDKLPFKENYFDYVVSLECLEHIESDKIFGILKEIKRVLKEKGKAIFSVPINEKYTLTYNPNNHLRRYSRRIFIQELIYSGFKIEKTIELYAFSRNYHFKKLINSFLKLKKTPNILIVKCTKR